MQHLHHLLLVLLHILLLPIEDEPDKAVLVAGRGHATVAERLEAAEGVVRAEVNHAVLAEVALAGAPEGLQLVPLGDDGVALVAEDHGHGKRCAHVGQVLGRLLLLLLLLLLWVSCKEVQLLG